MIRVLSASVIFLEKIKKEQFVIADIISICPDSAGF